MARRNRDLPPLRPTMDAHGVDLPYPAGCVFCACEDLRVGGSEAATYVACPKCGADGPIVRGLFGAVREYNVTEKSNV